MGACAGGHVYSPAITDFTVMVDKTSQMFITGPDVIKTVTGEDVTMEELGGARTHNTKSGNAHYLASRRGRRARVRQGAALLPAPEQPGGAAVVRRRGRPRDHRRGPRARHADPGLAQPAVRHAHGDQRGARRRRVPRGAGAVRAEHRRRVRPGRGPLRRRRRQPADAASPGTLDIDASEKAARFVRTCDAFNVPVLTFVDVPGFLPGTDQEWNGHHPARREADLRLRGGDRPADHGDHPQGVRRRVRRHGLQAPRRGHQRRLADRRRSPSWARRAR